jgi:hypothetical protein
MQKNTVVTAGVLAIVAELLCFFLFLFPLFGPAMYIAIVFLYPAMFVWRLLLPITPEAFNLISLFLIAFLQFFSIIWAILLFKKKREWK